MQESRLALCVVLDTYLSDTCKAGKLFSIIRPFLKFKANFYTVNLYISYTEKVADLLNSTQALQNLQREIYFQPLTTWSKAILILKETK